MMSLMLALLAGTAANGQAVQAEFQSCALENGRYVCRYVMPDIVIVPVQGTNITAEAPSAVLGSAPSADGAATPPSTTTAAPHASDGSVPSWAASMTATNSPPAPSTVVRTPVVPAPTSTVPTTTAAVTSPTTPSTTSGTVTEPGPIRPIDAGVLTEREAQLVGRCADAGWMSLCMPDDRRAARTLRDKQNAYLAVRRDVTRLLGDNRCDAAVRTALDGGYLALARETREYCAASTPPSAPTRTPATRTPAPRPAVPVTPAPTRSTVLPELESRAAQSAAD